MSRRRGHTRSVRRSGSGASLAVWTADILNELDPLTTTTGITLLDKSDFAPAQEITMRGIYGWLHVMPLTGGIIDDTVFMMMGVYDEDLTITGSAHMDPGTVSNLTDEDIFWTGGAITTNISTTIGGGGVYMPIHITNMRKIRKGMRINLTFTNGGGSGENLISGMLRTYSKVGPG